MAKLSEIDKRIIETLTGRDRIKALLSARSLSLKAFAERHNLWVENVSRCIGGDRPLPEVRAALATELELTLNEVSQIIDG